MNLGAPEIIIIAIVIFALFGYKKLPDASRAVGRSLRIFKGEMKGMKDEDVKSRAEAETVRSPIPPAQTVPPQQQAYTQQQYAAPAPPQEPQQQYAPPAAPQQQPYAAPQPAPATDATAGPTVIDPTGAPAAPPQR